MAPVDPPLPPCDDILNHQGQHYSNDTMTTMATTVTTEAGHSSEDLSALLYIVVTLLFYSTGIIIGIIIYLKRERADMEEEKVFDMYLAMKRDPFNVYRKERVKQMARHLHKVERATAERVERERLERERIAQENAHDSGGSDGEVGHHASTSRGGSKKSKHVKISDCVRTPSTRSSRRGSSGGEGETPCTLYPLVFSTASMIVGSTTARAPVFHMPRSTSGELLAPPGGKYTAEHGERRGALPMGAHVLYTRNGGGGSDGGGGEGGGGGLRDIRRTDRGMIDTHDSDTLLLISGPVVEQPTRESPRTSDQLNSSKGNGNGVLDT
ncbi:hypothetical protein V1264_023748 [Littorina saxatilis]|uniref:Uncharacterized protein n=1 Tax=Littorina saxatilis TaxID=31220 RepID=A0AAN9B954_9CAEN